MHTTKRFFHNKKGLQTVTVIFMLLLMLALLVSLFGIFFRVNLSNQRQMALEQARIQEKIMLAKEINHQNITSRVTVTNIGEIEVRIRALYKTIEGATTLVCDPSAEPLNIDTHISPSNTLTVELTDFNINGTARIVAATERGTKSFEYDPYLVENNEVELKDYDPTKLYVGPLMLKFDDFWYIKTMADGSFDPADQWQLGWNVTDSTPVKIAWNITVMNIGDKNITLNRLSAFNLVLSGSPTSIPWYIEPTNKTTYTQPLIINQTVTITFIWDRPAPSAPQSLGSTFKGGACWVFLTFFGVYHELDGITTTAYAQTIPFEAAVQVAG